MKSPSRSTAGRSRSMSPPATLLCGAAARDAGPDRDACRLRHQPVRRLRGAARRRGGEELHAAGAGARRRRADDHRGAGGPTGEPIACIRCRRRFIENHGLQCGFCTPGMVMTAVDFAARNPAADRSRSPRAGWKATSAAAPAIRTSSPSVIAGAAAMHARRAAAWRVEHGEHHRHRRMRRVRKEDLRFLTGRGNYVADLKRPGMAHGVFVRSPHAHAVLRGDRHGRRAGDRPACSRC